ncbi:proton-conducting transporter transmembrane domain-containing protein [Desulfovibrio legallii]|jgi:hydrogenase-4 component F|uniref:Hydrogenase-4 component F n=1 Tax=Desulfovibrio legallii TaxID=571438 RepID=A0A1G7MRZ8_9BACT|nr:proton-conducting transporter membrane subunit [Desulfovibrio legallii]SDF63879.1 hydrogenase-4 component F [Desulfovibrio legallii]
MLTTLLFLPLAVGCAMLLWGRAGVCRAGLPLTALIHAVLACAVAARVAQGETPTALGGLLAPDALGALFLALASLLFLAASVYAVHYLREEERIGEHTNILDHGRFTNAPERRFTACLCFFLASMTLVTVTPHLGAQWVGIEATTLSSAPLIYFHRHKSSLEATWKYLIICSVGIALALLGNILLAVAFHGASAAGDAAGLDQAGWFVRHAAQAEPTWLKAAFVFLLVGYGTKMGLAPLHNWLPDAHSQAPSLVSALLSGALLNCAMLGMLRGHQIMLAAGLGGLSGGMLTVLGLLSLLTAAVFIVGQGHYKRMLAYSSVEHMGILALGVGVGGLAVSGAMLHAVCHSLVKCMLFLLSGNILARYHTYSSYDVRGMRWTMPFTAALWTAGFLAVAGSPPFGIFVSELLIFKGMLAADRPWIAAAYLLLLAVIFVGLSVAVLRMVQGNRPTDMPAVRREALCSVLPPLALGLAVLTLGLWVPDGLWDFLTRAAALIGG